MTRADSLSLCEVDLSLSRHMKVGETKPRDTHQVFQPH